MKYRQIFLIIFSTLILFDNSYSQSALAGKDSVSYNFIIRPHGGLTNRSGQLVTFFGIRALLPATASKRFGLTGTRFTRANQNSFYSLGIILEQKLFNWLNSSIGTVGYFNYGDQEKRVPGLTVSTGWEPEWDSMVTPYVAYRSDFIFAKDFEALQSLYVGINVSF